AWTDSGMVFTTGVGTPLDPRNVTTYFHRLLDKAELPSIRFHDLRHTCASLLLAQGVPLRVVMETLGHSQISLTADTYTHVMPVLQREAADRMEALFQREAWRRPRLYAARWYARWYIEGKTKTPWSSRGFLFWRLCAES